MIALFFISLFTLLIYIAVVAHRFGVPESISESCYLFPKRGRLLFWSWSCLTAIPLMIFWLNVSEETLQLLPFFSCSALVLVGTAGMFKEDSVRKVHVFAAILCASTSQLWIALFTPYWAISIVLASIFGIIGYRTKGVVRFEGEIRYAKNSITFFLEMAAFLSTYIAVYLYYLK
jgi:hypothetical protein